MNCALPSELLGRQRTDWAAIAREALESFALHARERRINLKAELDCATLTGDPERLLQVATNLIGNAVLLEVSDNGPGISSEDLPQIFDRFYRGDKSRTGNNGSGLGLAIARSVVEAHNGVIEVSSAPGQGATFTVTLPAGIVS